MEGFAAKFPQENEEEERNLLTLSLYISVFYLFQWSYITSLIQQSNEIK